MTNKMNAEYWELMPREWNFCLAYISSFNQTYACIEAGYSDKGASVQGGRLLSRVNVAAAIDFLIKKRTERTLVTQDSVIKIISDTIERCAQAVPVLNAKGHQVFIETADGQIAAAYKFDAANVLKGTEQLGKHVKLFTDKVEMTGKDGVPLNDKKPLTIEDAAALIAAHKEK